MSDRCFLLDLLVDPDVATPPIEMLRRLVAFAGDVEPTLPAGDWTVTLRLTNDEQIAEIHDRFFGDPTPTDVITFPSGDALTSEEGYFGDIVVSVMTAAENAAAMQHSANREIAFLLLHGLLHLSGYDDASDDDRDIMLARQSLILERFEQAEEPDW